MVDGGSDTVRDTATLDLARHGDTGSIGWTRVTGVWLFRTTWQGYVRNMSVVPQLPVSGADDSLLGADRAAGDVVRAEVTCSGHVRVEAETHRRIEFCDGAAVEVLASYPVRSDADLFSLARVLAFHCAECREPCEATIVAVRDQGLLCPSCYAALGTVRDPPEQQEDRTSSPDARADTTEESTREPTAA